MSDGKRGLPLLAWSRLMVSTVGLNFRSTSRQRVGLFGDGDI